MAQEKLLTTPESLEVLYVYIVRDELHPSTLETTSFSGHSMASMAGFGKMGSICSPILDIILILPRVGEVVFCWPFPLNS